MKKVILSAAFALATTAAVAGTVAPPLVKPNIIIEQTPTSSVDHAVIPPLMFLISVATAIWVL